MLPIVDRRTNSASHLQRHSEVVLMNSRLTRCSKHAHLNDSAMTLREKLTVYSRPVDDLFSRQSQLTALRQRPNSRKLTHLIVGLVSKNRCADCTFSLHFE